MPSPRTRLTREQALDYLERRNLLTKPKEQYTTAYAKRLASQYQRAETSGRELSRKEARGKHPKAGEPRQKPERYKRAPVQKISGLKGEGPLPKGERRAEGKEKEQAIVFAPVVVRDLEKPLRMMGYPTKVDSVLWKLLVYGYAQASPTNRKTWSPTKPVHYRVNLTEENLKDYLKNDKMMPILDFINAYSEYNWTEIISISVLGYEL